jgi:DNA-binding GntR family transcriptional regulator
MGKKTLNKMKNSTKSKKAIVYGDLKSRIINNLIKPGEPLNEGVLSKELKISKTPIREALQQLEKEGFIENIPVKGAFVSRISIQDIREIFEIREILECEVIKRAALKVDPDKVQILREKFLSSESDSKKVSAGGFKSGDEVHSFIFETYGNDRLMEIYRRLQDHIVRSRVHFFNQSPSGRSGESFKEHLEILDALMAKDPLKGESTIRNHLRNSLEYLKKIM